MCTYVAICIYMYVRMSHDPCIFLIGVFTPFQVEELQKANLAKIICANADDIQQVPRDVFILQNVSEFVNCSEIEEVNLNAWKECDSEWDMVPPLYYSICVLEGPIVQIK